VFDREREADAFVDSVRCVVSRDGPVVFAWCLLGKHDRLGVRTESARVWTERQKRKGVPGTFLNNLSEMHTFSLSRASPRIGARLQIGNRFLTRKGPDG